MSRDILVMREVAQYLDKRNLVIEPDPEWTAQINAEPLADEFFEDERVEVEARAKAAREYDHLNREGQWPTQEQQGSIRCTCGNLLTIEDRYSRCRECMLSL